MNCPSCFAPNQENTAFCPQCGHSMQTGPQATPPTQAVPAAETIPEALSAPIQFTDAEMRKRFGRMIRGQRRPVGLGYITAVAGAVLMVLLFFPLFDARYLFNISSSGSAFSLLTTMFSPGAESALLALENSQGFLSVAGLPFDTAFLLARVAVLAMFLLPVLVLLFSFLARGASRFYLLLFCALLGGGGFTVLRVLINSFTGYMQGGITLPTFFPAVDLSIFLYFVVFLFAFLGSFTGKKPDRTPPIPE